MAETVSNSGTKRCAVVTGANKGLGLEICRQLASKGVLVVLTARDEKRGVEAVENLRQCGVSDVVFHQLDLVNPTSIASLAEFIKDQFGKLDILVNNAGISGSVINNDALRAHGQVIISSIHVLDAMVESFESAEECLKANYYGTKQVTEELLPLLQLSNSATIVNVSSSIGQLKNITNEWAKEMLSDVDGLTEEKIDEVLNEFVKDYREGLLESKSWAPALPAYTLSKAAVNAYTRILAKKFPTIRINCVCPGFLKTDFNSNTGTVSVEEGAEGPVSLALTPDGSGQFFSKKKVSSFD